MNRDPNPRHPLLAECTMMTTSAPQISGPYDLFKTLRKAMYTLPEGVVHGSDGAQVSYGELLTLVERVQAVLPGHRGAGDEVVAICTAKTPACVAAILATLATGRAYAPLDPSHPETRLIGILDDLRPTALIVDETTRVKLEIWARRAQVRLIDLERLPPHRLAFDIPAYTGQELAAVLHTSGSTGKPKRVEICAPAIHAFQDWVADEMSIMIDDCLISHAPFAFDLSFLDIFVSLMSGSGLALCDAKCARNGARILALLDEAQVTVWHSAPSALKLLAEIGGGQTLPQMRCVLFAGEPMPARTLHKLFEIFPNAHFVNIYGCTETNDTFFYSVPRVGTPEHLPLGRKLPYVEYHIVDGDLRPMDGVCEGELWVRCPTMMRGYSDPALTREVMITCDGKDYYRTGDYVRRDEAGLIHFVGRRDAMIKLNGVRVDLNEVDRALQSHPNIDDATCFVTDTDDGKQLNAWISSKDAKLNSLDIRLHLNKLLPVAALPKRYIISVSALPKNSNGKACRRNLAQLAAAGPVRAADADLTPTS